jgi:hypothetical protein
LEQGTSFGERGLKPKRRLGLKRLNPLEQGTSFGVPRSLNLP